MILTNVPEGSQMTIIAGREYNNQRNWGRVELTKGDSGWMAEENSNEYWLEPTS